MGKFYGTSDPIISSLLDNDMYKFTMGQFVEEYCPDVVVEFALTNRTKGVKLEDYIELADLKSKLAATQKLRFGKSEIEKT